MAFDVNGLFGRWPVRTPGIWEPAEYLRTMDRFGIARALVTSTVALLDNTRQGNDVVAGLLRLYPDRLVGACVVNPHPGVEHALSEARRRIEEGFSAVRICPGLHGYSLTDAEILDPLMAEAMRMAVPVIVTLRVTVAGGFPDTPAAGVRMLAQRHPEVALIVAGSTLGERLLLTRAARACPNLYLENSQMHGSEAVRATCEAVGGSRLLLGTGMGVLYASPAVRRVETAVVSSEDRYAVLEGNALRLLRLQ